MKTFDASRIQWRAPWEAISTHQAAKVEAEVHSEVCDGHVLFGRSVTAVGHRIDRDDMLFWLGDSPPRFAVVHLTFQHETQPEWPHTSLFDSLDTWLQQCMIPDAEEYAL